MAEKPKKNIFRALKSRNYKLFFIGQSISLTGTWMQNIAMSWLVYRLTGSTVLLGLVGFLSHIPAFFLAPFAGALADRLNRRRLMIIIQSTYMTWAFIFAALVLTGKITTPLILLFSLIGGIIHAIDMPVRQSFLIEMIEDKSDIGNAIALNSSIFNSARLMGPVIAGVLIGFVGEGVCFFLNGLSYMAIIIALLLMKIRQSPEKSSGRNILGEIKEGFHYAFSIPSIRAIIILLSTISLTGSSYLVLMPVFAKEVFHKGPETLGFFVGAVGLGALMGALFLASRRSVLGMGRLIAIFSGVFGLGLIAFSRSGVFWLSLSILLFVGFGIMTYIGSGNTLIQTIVDEEKRGRVMSIFTISLLGLEPIGCLIAGSAASHIGAPNTVLIIGIISVAASLVFTMQLSNLAKTVNPRYVRRAFEPVNSRKK